MKACWSPLIGRFGNQLFQYAFARACAEQNGLELHTPRWIGEKIFQIERTPEKRDGDLILGGYCQNQVSLAYTRKQAREWFKFRPEIEEQLKPFRAWDGTIVAHRRIGDYKDSQHGYVEVSQGSYWRSAVKFGYDPESIRWVTEENPSRSSILDALDAPFLPDFYRLLTASVLFRGNSSFSYWAAVLGNGRVFSPVINGLKGGKEEDVEFVEGNHPRISEIGDCTELHLREGV